jgi:hypothetical protein
MQSRLELTGLKIERKKGLKLSHLKAELSGTERLEMKKGKKFSPERQSRQ